MQDSDGPGGHAVDTPVGVAVFVANGDGEAAVVGPDDLDVGVLVALNVEFIFFAGIGCFVLGSIGSFT